MQLSRSGRLPGVSDTRVTLSMSSSSSRRSREVSSPPEHKSCNERRPSPCTRFVLACYQRVRSEVCSYIGSWRCIEWNYPEDGNSVYIVRSVQGMVGGQVDGKDKYQYGLHRYDCFLLLSVIPYILFSRTQCWSNGGCGSRDTYGGCKDSSTSTIAFIGRPTGGTPLSQRRACGIHDIEGRGNRSAVSRSQLDCTSTSDKSRHVFNL